MRKLACAVGIFISLVFFFLILWVISCHEAAAFDQQEIKCYSGGKVIYKTKMTSISYDVENNNILWIRNEKGKATMVNNASCVLETDEDYVEGTE